MIKEKKPHGNKGVPKSPEHRQKVIDAQTGKKRKPFSTECIANMSKNNPKYWLGKKRSEETKLKISVANSGEKHPRWQGGISFEPYGFEFNRKLKNLIRERDNHTCQLCGKHESENVGKQKKHSVHHIDYDKQNNDPANLITLCNDPCHPKTNSDRGKWKRLFQKRMSGISSMVSII